MMIKFEIESEFEFEIEFKGMNRHFCLIRVVGLVKIEFTSLAIGILIRVNGSMTVLTAD